MNLKKGDKVKYVGEIPYIFGCAHAVRADFGDVITACCDLTVDGNKFQKVIEKVEKPKEKTDKKDSK